jgi:HEAT repeat protein
VGGENPFDAVVGEIAALLRSPSASAGDKTAAIWGGLAWDLQTLGTGVLKEALRFAAAEDRDLIVRMSAVVALLVQNDISVLPLAEQELSDPDSQLPDNSRLNLSSAIDEGVKGDAAVPALTRLLKNPDVRVRRAAAMALRNTKTKLAIDGLTLALEDGDAKVRYYAVIGLAEITGETEWRPSEKMFRANEGRYLRYWKSRLSLH